MLGMFGASRGNLYLKPNYSGAGTKQTYIVSALDISGNTAITGTLSATAIWRVTDTGGSHFILIGNQNGGGTNTPVILKRSKCNAADWHGNIMVCLGHGRDCLRLLPFPPLASRLQGRCRPLQLLDNIPLMLLKAFQQVILALIYFALGLDSRPFVLHRQLMGMKLALLLFLQPQPHTALHLTIGSKISLGQLPTAALSSTLLNLK
jgi:hypothetical protein